VAPRRPAWRNFFALRERKGRAQEAIPYNALVVARSDVARRAGERREASPVQGRLQGFSKVENRGAMCQL